MAIKNLISRVLSFFSSKQTFPTVEGSLSYQSGPPDLDEMWRNFNRRMTQMWRGKRSPQPILGFSVLLLAVIVVLILWGVTGFYVVEPSEQAVVFTFGRFEAVVNPGLNWHFPYPIQTYEKYNVRGVRTLDVGAVRESGAPSDDSVMLTADENIVNIAFSVLYTIKDVKDFAFNNRGSEEFLVRQVAEAAIREVVGKNNMDFVLYEGREQIAQSTEALMQSILDRYKTGVQIVKVNLQNAQPPEQVQEAFNDAVKAVQDRERQKNEGQAYANNVIPRAQGAAARLIEEGKAYKENVVNIATGDVSRFNQYLKLYQQSPALTKERLYLDTLSSIYQKTPKVFLDVSAKTDSRLFLTLPSLGALQTHDSVMKASASAGHVDVNASTSSTPVDSSDNASASSAVLPRFRSSSLLETRDRNGGESS